MTPHRSRAVRGRPAATAAALVVLAAAALPATATAVPAAPRAAATDPAAGADVSDPDAWQEIAEQAAGFGPVGVLVSNAYTVDVTPAHTMTLESWERQLAVNLTGAFLGVKAVLPAMREHGGAVVLTSSVHAHKGAPGHPADAASKGAPLSLCGQLSVECGPDVRVNAVLPGPILTAAWDRAGPEDRARSVAETAAGRFGTSEEAAAIAFLAAPEAAYITGAGLVVDGGWSVVKASA
ncbi:SDR family NAD(P)-dependent oxidoreductase [Actinacidiphila yeochonensis]|uniref:SDR family NAD(P)-dependent oxidoreductase n=1 Tax=Actinacidiphila yeochonensis TaxID=89050 RepID=UPI000A6FAD0A|nr:SDR family oxidoreductase [Actinacidiphila yeochonensis]